MFEPSRIPLPDLDDPNFEPFWKGAREGKLKLQKCAGCGTYRWPPRIACRDCRSMDVEWEAVPPLGTLYTYTIVGRATAKGFPNVPYTVGFVTLDKVPHVRIIGNVVGIDPAEVRIGMPLEGRFVAAGPGGEMTLIHWSPAAAGA